MKLFAPAVLSVLLLAGCATTPSGSSSATSAAEFDAAGVFAQDADSSQEQAPPPESDDDSRGFGHRLLWWIPNRISDVLDIVRLRLRLGPGFAIGARVTELVDFNLGGYTSIFVGIPGPRRERSFNWPFGFESMAGMELSVLDGTDNSSLDGPSYGWLEVGLGTQLLIVGFDLGVDVWEVVDFAAGILTIDPVSDDI